MHWIFGIGAVTRGTRVRDATSTLPGPPLLVQTCSERVNTTLAAGGLGSTPQWCNTHAAAHDGQGLPPSKLIHPQSRFMFLYSLLSMVTAPSPSRLTAAPPLQRVAQVSVPDSSPRSLMKALLRGQVLLLYVAIVVQAGPINSSLTYAINCGIWDNPISSQAVVCGRSQRCFSAGRVLLSSRQIIAEGSPTVLSIFQVVLILSAGRRLRSDSFGTRICAMAKWSVPPEPCRRILVL